VLIEPADEVEEELATRLDEGQIAEFIQHDEVNARQMLGIALLPSVAVSVSRQLTRSTALKKRLQAPVWMQLLTMARWN
jgi:hypothetical protein